MTRLALAAALACLLPLAARAGSQDFSVVNRTGYQIDAIYVSQIGNSRWGGNVMGSAVLLDGETVAISFAREEPACHWDLLVQYHDREKITWTDVDLCNVARVALVYDRRSGRTLARAR